MNIQEVFDVTKSPLTLAIIIYLVISGIVVHLKPVIIFGDEEENKYVNSYNVWIFFILLAVFVYAIVCSYASNKIRNDYCSKLVAKDLKGLMELSTCKA